MRKFTVKVNGKKYDVEIEEIFGGQTSVAAEDTQLMPQPIPVHTLAETAPEIQAPSKTEQQAGEAVLAPLPGTVLDVLVKNGESIKSGQVLFILEALKMENEIIASHDGVISHVAVSKGEAVNAGDALAYFN